LGYDLQEVDYALLRWSISASLAKVDDALAVLATIKNGLSTYDYQTGNLVLSDYIDTLHGYCDSCHEKFDHAQILFADYLAGNCDGNCESITADDFAK
jgi:hypothetical protein